MFAFKAVCAVEKFKRFPNNFQNASYPISHLMKSWMRPASVMTENYEKLFVPVSSTFGISTREPSVNLIPDLITLLSIFETETVSLSETGWRLD